MTIKSIAAIKPQKAVLAALGVAMVHPSVKAAGFDLPSLKAAGFSAAEVKSCRV